MCRVTLGKPVEQFAAIRIAHAPPGHHSVIGRPSAGGLNYPEYVIYRGEQVLVNVHVHVHVHSYMQVHVISKVQCVHMYIHFNDSTCTCTCTYEITRVHVL